MITRGREPEQEGLEFAMGSSHRVHLRDVEAELGRLWDAAGDEARSRGREGVMRLREFNLLVYATGEETAGRVSTVITWLAERHPARVIVLVELPGGGRPGELEAWVTTACYLSGQGGRHVCWEQVTIPARGEAVPMLHAAANSLLVPDLPTVLWWPGTPDFEGHAFRRLSDESDMVVVDSSGFADAVDGLGSVARLVYDGARDYGVIDLNWARLTPWREMLAQLFDEPERQRLLPHIRRVVVTFGAEGTVDHEQPVRGPAVVRALLLGAWLATRLGWTSRSGRWTGEGQAFGTIMGTREDTQVEMVLEYRDLGSESVGGLIGVSIETEPAAGEPGPSLTLVRTPETCVCVANVHDKGSEALVRTFDISVAPESRLLSEELEVFERDEVYEEAVIMAAALGALPGARCLAGCGSPGEARE